MRQYHNSSHLIRNTLNIFNTVYAQDVFNVKAVFFEPEYYKMPLINVHFYPGQNQEIMLLAQLGYSILIPGLIMLGEADSIKPGLLCPADKLSGLKLTIVGQRYGMSMKINKHSGLLGYPLLRIIFLS